MSARYAAIPTENTRERYGSGDRNGQEDDEMEAAFAGSDDEYDDALEHQDAETRPLNPENTSSPLHDALKDSSDPLHEESPAQGRAHQRTFSTYSVTGNRTAGGVPEYDFERPDYDFPPPGSPPRGDRALPNDWGNSNGLVPSSPVVPGFTARQGVSGLRTWARRVLPAPLARRLGGREPDRRVYGGGIGNDGVFANVTAKPTTHPTRAANSGAEGEDSIYALPEFAQKEAPPTYAQAQQDAVPPYWETTILAPSSYPNFASLQPGELPIDGLPAGTVFAFLWNALVSISFQFVGFLLTYFLHSSHAARLGSRAGLGVTLVQYGFALRAGRDGMGDSWDGTTGDGFGGGSGFDDSLPAPPVPSFPSAADAESWYSSHNATDMPTGVPVPDTVGYSSAMMNDLTTEWLAFLLMTIGWFILLNSLLGFWRVKRWERSIVASQNSPSPNPSQPSSTEPSSEPSSGPGNPPPSGDASIPPPPTLSAHLERTLGLRVPNLSMLRLGLGLPTPGSQSRDRSVDLERGATFDPYIFEYTRDSSFDEDDDMGPIRARARGAGVDVTSADVDAAAPLLANVPEGHPDRARLLAEAYANERRLQADLRAAGLL